MPVLNDLKLLLWTVPGLAIGLASLLWFRLVCARSGNASTGLSGFAAARSILDAARLTHVPIAATPGQSSDHFDSRTGSVRLSNATYHGRQPAAVGVAARVAGCAVQQAARPGAGLLHNLAAVGAYFGVGPGLMMVALGSLAGLPALAWVGLALFNLAFLLQMICLPLQVDACFRARRMLDTLGLFDGQTAADVTRVMNASILMGPAVTLQPFITLASWITR